MFSENVSEEAQFRHEQANYFCHEVLNQLRVFEYLGNIYDIRYNQFKPGLILRFLFQRDTAPAYCGLRGIYRKAGIMSYFDWRLFKNTIHINLKKEYINKIEELETVLRMKGIY